MVTPDTDAVRAAREALAQAPHDAVRLFVLADALDGEAREAEAIPLYENAIRAGLDDDHGCRARVQLGSSLRVVGRPQDAVHVLEDARERYPASDAARLFLALALVDAGRAVEAVADLVHLAVERVDSPALDTYRAPLCRYADGIS